MAILLRTIQKTQNDPTRLRSLVYDVARLSLGKHVLANYQQIGSDGLQQQISDLETAINQIEAVSLRLEDLSQKEVSQQHKEASADVASQLLKRPTSASDTVSAKALTVREFFEETVFEDLPPEKSPALVRPPMNEVYVASRAEILEPLHFRIPAFGSGPKRRQVEIGFGLQLIIAVVIGLGIYAASVVGFDYAGSRSSREQAETLASATMPAKPLSAAAQALGVPLPTVYGVYAVSEGKLYELDPLSMKVPDGRIAISAIISNPSRVAVPQGKLQFIIFRRDLMSNAPTEAFVRVVARVEREMKFSAGGSPTTTNVEGEWAIRSKSYVLRVAPLGDSPEMIVLRPADAEQALSPGRYALVFAGKGYDFTIDGQVTDAAQCLERSNVVGGIVYSECRTAPTQLAN